MTGNAVTPLTVRDIPSLSFLFDEAPWWLRPGCCITILIDSIGIIPYGYGCYRVTGAAPPPMHRLGLAAPVGNAAGLQSHIRPGLPQDVRPVAGAEQEHLPHT